jgi:hypothetical protein
MDTGNNPSASQVGGAAAAACVAQETDPFWMATVAASL